MNYMAPHQTKVSEEAKLQFIQGLLRDNAIELWQSLTINHRTTLQDVLNAIRKEYSKHESPEVATSKWDKLQIDPATQTLSDEKIG